jgi:hypothetical protein
MAFRAVNRRMPSSDFRTIPLHPMMNTFQRSALAAACGGVWLFPHRN